MSMPNFNLNINGLEGGPNLQKLPDPSIILILAGCSTTPLTSLDYKLLDYKYHSDNVFDLLVYTPCTTTWEDSHDFAYIAAAYIAQERGFKYFQEGSGGGRGVSISPPKSISGCRFYEITSTFTCFKNKPESHLKNNNLLSVVRPVLETDLTIKTMEARYGENATSLKKYLKGADPNAASVVSATPPKKQSAEESMPIQTQPNESQKTVQPSTGGSVTAVEIEQRLKALGYPVGAADGIFGPKTLTAIKLFQRKNGLTPDGFVGPETMKKLFSK